MKSDILREQLDYYRARAQEYDESLQLTGRFAQPGPADDGLAREWTHAAQALLALGKVERALELACGTGLWTRELLQIAGTVTALDGAPEMIEASRAKLNNPRVSYGCVELFEWEPQEAYDLVFFAFWLSHVPPDRLDPFLEKVSRAVRPGGRVFIVDEPAGGEQLSGPTSEGQYQTRALHDGRTFRIIKVYYDPHAIGKKLERLGFKQIEAQRGAYFFHLTATRPQPLAPGPWPQQTVTISLGTDVPDYLPDLLRSHNIRLGHVKVGLWQGPQGARREAAVYPGLPTLVHGDLQAAGDSPLPGREVEELAALVADLRSPWFSVHLEYRTQPEFDALKRTLYLGSDLQYELAVERIVARVEQLSAAISAPIILENMSHWPARSTDLAAQPDFICEVVERTGCGFLLDLAHARVSAERLGMSPQDYLLKLPLERLVEVHISGPRRKLGILRDAHEPLSQNDYALLTWLLTRHRPQAVTLEYWKDPAHHAEQLKRLTAIVEQ